MFQFQSISPQAIQLLEELDSKNYNLVFQKTSSLKHDMDCLVIRGICFSYGFGTKLDDEISLSLYHHAAENNSLFAKKCVEFLKCRQHNISYSQNLIDYVRHQMNVTLTGFFINWYGLLQKSEGILYFFSSAKKGYIIGIIHYLCVKWRTPYFCDEWVNLNQRHCFDHYHNLFLLASSKKHLIDTHSDEDDMPELEPFPSKRIKVCND